MKPHVAQIICMILLGIGLAACGSASQKPDGGSAYLGISPAKTSTLEVEKPKDVNHTAPSAQESATGADRGSPSSQSTPYVVSAPGLEESDNPYHTPTTGQDEAPKMIIPDLQNMPLYPNAKGVQIDRDVSSHSMTTFDISGSMQDALNFYKDILPKQGWAVVRENRYYPGIDFLWRDTKGPTPWNMDLHVSGELLGGGRTRIYLGARRWPDISKIPLYPGAEHVEVNHSESNGYVQFITTTYTILAKADDIERYYKSTLESNTWLFRGGSISDASPDGMFFVYDRGGGEMIVGGEVSILAQPASDGYNRVELRAKSVDFR